MDVLFVGNGINRCANIVPGWDTLFSSAVNIPSFQAKRSLTPTMEYEQNVHAIFEAGSTHEKWRYQGSYCLLPA